MEEKTSKAQEIAKQVAEMEKVTTKMTLGMTPTGKSDVEIREELRKELEILTIIPIIPGQSSSDQKLFYRINQVIRAVKLLGELA